MAQVEEVKILQVDTTKSVNAVRELRKSMKDLDSAFISGTISEEEYIAETKKLESEMFKVTDAHKDAKLSINDFGVQMKNVATVGKSVTGALTGIQAGMNALGLESSGIAEQISKLQNLQALTEAFGALKDDGVKEVIDAFVKAGFVPQGQDLTDADLRFIIAMGEAFTRWFESKQDSA